jgi:hypothetical protein
MTGLREKIADAVLQVLTEPDEATVERVARSLFRSDNGKHWGLLTDDVRQDYLLEAKAAIAAILED